MENSKVILIEKWQSIQFIGEWLTQVEKIIIGLRRVKKYNEHARCFLNMLIWGKH